MGRLVQKLHVLPDVQTTPDTLAITCAGAAMLVSDIPLTSAVAGVRVGLVDGELVVNPTMDQLKRSSLDLVLVSSW